MHKNLRKKTVSEYFWKVLTGSKEKLANDQCFKSFMIQMQWQMIQY